MHQTARADDRCRKFLAAGVIPAASFTSEAVEQHGRSSLHLLSHLIAVPSTLEQLTIISLQCPRPPGRYTARLTAARDCVPQ